MGILKTVSILLGNGNDIFAGKTDYPSGTSPSVGLMISNLNHDGKPDLTTVSSTNQTISVLLNSAK